MGARDKIEELIRTSASYNACRQPNLPVDAPEIMKFIENLPPLDCKAAGIDWVVCEVSFFN